MKSLEKKRDELAKNYVKHCQDNMHAVYGIAEAYCKADFKAGWDACTKEYEKLNRDAVRLWNENELLKKQLEVAKEALQFYANAKNWECDETYDITKIIDDESICHYSNVDGDFDHVGGKRARQALKDLESAGE